MIAGSPVRTASQRRPSPKANWSSSMRAALSSLAHTVEPARPAPTTEIETPSIGNACRKGRHSASFSSLGALDIAPARLSHRMV